MSNNDSLKNIAVRLFKENICVTPLDERSLETVSEYMNFNSSNSDLCRRLSDVELNYVQISSDAESANDTIIESNNIIIVACKSLVDQWHQGGVLLDYFYYSSETDIRDIRASYINTLEFIRNQLRILSDSFLIISETAAQIRACAASFTEIYKETKLAIYAAMLNRDVEAVLDCRSTSLQAHASTKECEKLSSKLMGNARECSRIINCINNMILEVNQHLNIEKYEHETQSKVSPAMAKQTVCSTIGVLENIKIEKYTY